MRDQGVPADAAPSHALRRGFAALEHRDFRLYWGGQVVSLIGTWMQLVSLPWLVVVLGGTPLHLGIVAGLQFAPSILLAPFAGVLADRVDKRKALISTQALAMIQAASLLALCVTGVVQLAHVVVLALIMGVINGVDMPVRQALAAGLVSPKALRNAIALNSMSFNLARVAGPALGGILISLGDGLFRSPLAGVSLNFAVNTLTFVAVLVAMLHMRPASQLRVPQPRTSILDGIREGYHHSVGASYVLWPLVLLGGVGTFGFNFQVLLPLFALHDLKVGAEGYGSLYAAMGIGALAASLTLAYMPTRPTRTLLLGGGVLFSVSVIGLGHTRSVMVAYPLIIASGYFSMMMLNTVNSTIQTRVPDALRGRVMSLYVAVFASTAPLGGIFAGYVAQHWGAPAGFVTGGTLSLAVIVVVAWRLLAVEP